MLLNNTGLQSKSSDPTKILIDRQKFDMYENFIRQVVPNFKDKHAKEFVLNADNAGMLFYWLVSIKRSINPNNLFEEQMKFLSEFEDFILEVSGLQPSANLADDIIIDLNASVDYQRKLLSYTNTELIKFMAALKDLSEYSKERTVAEIAISTINYINQFYSDNNYKKE